jgi:hypothetical protein
MSLTYFGYCDPSTGVGTGQASLNTGAFMDWVTAGYACPGTGNQTLKKIGIQTRSADVYALVGIYNTSNQLVCHATSRKLSLLCDTAAEDIWTEWDDTETTWVIGTTLNGGDTYILVAAFAGNTGIWGTASQPSGTSKYINGDVTSTGMPSTLAAGTSYTQLLNIRAAVEPAESGTDRIIVIDEGVGINEGTFVKKESPMFGNTGADGVFLGLGNRI